MADASGVLGEVMRVGRESKAKGVMQWLCLAPRPQSPSVTVTSLVKYE